MSTPRNKTKPVQQELNRIRFEDLIEAIEELGLLTRACQVIGIDKKQVYRMVKDEPAYAERLRAAREIGKVKRIDWLETLAYEMAPTNPTMVMFLLKQMDPSYRESYNVTNSTTPANYVIDLSLPTGDDTPLDADTSTAALLV